MWDGWMDFAIATLVGIAIGIVVAVVATIVLAIVARRRRWAGVLSQQSRAPFRMLLLVVALWAAVRVAFPDDTWRGILDQLLTILIIAASAWLLPAFALAGAGGAMALLALIAGRGAGIALFMTGPHRTDGAMLETQCEGYVAGKQKLPIVPFTDFCSELNGTFTGNPLLQGSAPPRRSQHRSRTGTQPPLAPRPGTPPATWPGAAP